MWDFERATLIPSILEAAPTCTLYSDSLPTLIPSILEARPNQCHLSIAEMEIRMGKDVTVVTQNVDSLHQKAGSSHVVELHGAYRDVICMNASCGSRTQLIEVGVRVRVRVRVSGTSLLDVFNV